MPQPWCILGKNLNYYDEFEVIMNDFSPCRAAQLTSEKQLNFLFDLADWQSLDAEAFCSIHYRKEFAEMTANEASKLINLLNA